MTRAGVTDASGTALGAVLHRGAGGHTTREAWLWDGTPVIVKQADEDGPPDARDRLAHEAMILTRLRGITGVANLLRYEHETAVLTTARVRGDTLQAMVDHGTVRPAAVLGIMASLIGVLRGVHRRGIVHRDISPANIIVAPDGAVTLCDFGQACDRGVSTPFQDQWRDKEVGTPAFRSRRLRADPSNSSPWVDYVSVLRVGSWLMDRRVRQA